MRVKSDIAVIAFFAAAGVATGGVADAGSIDGPSAVSEHTATKVALRATQRATGLRDRILAYAQVVGRAGLEDATQKDYASLSGGYLACGVSARPRSTRLYAVCSCWQALTACGPHWQTSCGLTARGRTLRAMPEPGDAITWREAASILGVGSRRAAQLIANGQLTRGPRLAHRQLSRS